MFQFDWDHVPTAEQAWVVICQVAQDQWLLHPYHIMSEVFFIGVLLYFYSVPIHKAKQIRKDLPTPKEQEELIAEYRSEPFKSGKGNSNANVEGFERITVHSRKGFHITVSGTKALKKPTTLVDLSTFDYHGFGTNDEVLSIAKDTVRAYGTGSCGPRGFYGTVKPHLDLERNLSAFLGTENCIIFSFYYATGSTLIPCFSARNDYIVCDNGVSLPVQVGCSLSRSHLTYYRHEDMDHLEELMKDIVRKEEKARTLSRRSIVTEGVFRNSGDICSLRMILQLCEKYKFRLYLDDSYGFGALGATGRGTPEFFGIPVSEIDAYIGSMNTSLGGIGGFCAGANGMIEHQRLAATGYVFSASLPPYVTAASSKSLELMEGASSGVFKRLSNNATTFRRTVRKEGLPSNITMEGDEQSPLVFFRIADEEGDNVSDKSEEQLATVVNKLQARSILVHRHLFNNDEQVPATHGIRVVIKSAIPVQLMEMCAKEVSRTFRETF